MGEMPSGTMSWSTQGGSLQGIKDTNETITIDYRIPHGTKNGVRFSGTNRTAYLPNNKEGKEVLNLLVEAFQRKLTFKVGTSITTGQSNVVVWQGIHHKTSPSGGTSMFGYPDPTYFERVKDELAQRGLTADMIGKDIPTQGR